MGLQYTPPLRISQNVLFKMYFSQCISEVLGSSQPTIYGAAYNTHLLYFFSKCIFQNLFLKMYFSKFISQNVFRRCCKGLSQLFMEQLTIHTSCISLNVFLKMYFSKCISQNVFLKKKCIFKMHFSKCISQNVFLRSYFSADYLWSSLQHTPPLRQGSPETHFLQLCHALIARYL